MNQDTVNTIMAAAGGIGAGLYFIAAAVRPLTKGYTVLGRICDFITQNFHPRAGV